MIGDDREDDPESFANLIGKTRDIPRGPERVKNSASRSPHIRGKANRDEKAGSGAGGAFQFPDLDEPRLASRQGVQDAKLLALKRGEPEPDEKIDLHGLRRKGASRIIAARLDSARARGLQCVVVIHGRGLNTGAVLREAMPGWLSSPPCAAHVLAFAPAPKRLGGEGAMLVLLCPGDRRDQPD